MLIHGGNFGEGVLDFSVNTNPNVTKEMMADLVTANVEKALVYPEIDADGLLQYISRRIGVEPTRLVLGNGATDCLYKAMEVLKPATALVVEPTFSEYRQALKNVGTHVEILQYGFHDEPAAMEKHLLVMVQKLKADLVVVCNPNNPTGHTYSMDFIRELTALQKAHKGYVLVDESFRFFEGMESCYRKDDWNLIVLTSLTKYYGIPGLRIGYLSANHSMIADMKGRQQPWNLNGFAITVTRQLMEDEELASASKQWYDQEKAYMLSQLNSLEGLTVLPGRTNYLLCHLARFKGSEINEWLLKQSRPMGVRECTSFDGLSDSYIRIGLKSHEDNVQLIHGLLGYWRKQDE